MYESVTLPEDLFGVIGHFNWVKQPQKKWVCDFHDDAPPLPFQLQVAEAFF